LGTGVQENPAVGLFRFLEFLPATEVLSVISLMMIVIFFVTSADSGAMVLNMLSAKGVDNTPALQRMIWTLVIALAASLLATAGRWVTGPANRDDCQRTALCDCDAGCVLGFW
jgi:choline/glycine/proline betaine transport protein